jgi:hypothetical protein
VGDFTGICGLKNKLVAGMKWDVVGKNTGKKGILLRESETMPF